MGIRVRPVPTHAAPLQQQRQCLARRLGHPASTMEALQVAAYKRRARLLGAHLAFLDESGFLLIPSRRRTWGSEGKTPVGCYSYRHDRISALATLTDGNRMPGVHEVASCDIRHTQVAMPWPPAARSGRAGQRSDVSAPLRGGRGHPRNPIGAPTVRQETCFGLSPRR